MAKITAKRRRKLRVKGLMQPSGQSPWVEYMDFDIPDMSDEVFDESDERVHDSMVRQLVKKRVVKLEGFDDVIDELPGGGSIANAPPARLVDGHLFVAFVGNHAPILVLPESQGFLENHECFTHLVQQQYKEVRPAELFEVHLAFLHPLPAGDETDDQYRIVWLERRANVANPLTLAHYQRLFYVCDLTTIAYADLKKIAISVKPEFYSSFYSDCLQYCKDFCKKYFQFSLMHITGEMINRVDALAITGTRVETTSRKNLSSAVLGNRALQSSRVLAAPPSSEWWRSSSWGYCFPPTFSLSLRCGSTSPTDHHPCTFKSRNQPHRCPLSQIDDQLISHIVHRECS